MAEKDSLHPEPQPLTASDTAGKMLSSSRKDWDLTIEDVASNLNLGVDAITALENDEYERLPGYTFVKGYIRSYANLLRLDPDKVIARVDLKPEQLSEIPTSRGALKIKSRPQGKPKKSSGTFFKVLLLLLLLGILSLFGLNQLSKIDMQELAVFLKLPISGSSDKQDDGNEIIFSTTVTTPQGSTENIDNQAGEKKEALIRIE